MAATKQAFPAKGIYYSRLSEQPEIGLSHGPTESPVRKRSLVGPDLVPHMTGFSQGIIPPGSSVERHVHPSKYETFYCLKGQGKFIVGSSEETCKDDMEFELEPGCCITVAPQFWHSVHNTGDTDVVLLYFGVAC